MPLGLGIGLGLEFGGKVGFVPTAPVGANYAMLSHPSYWASDASHLVACAAGDAIRWWKDAVTGTWYEQVTSGSRLIARYDSASGKWYPEGTGTQKHPWVDLSGVSQTNVTFAVAYRQYSAVAYARLLSNNLRALEFNSATLQPSTLVNNTSGRINSASADSPNTDYRNIATFNGATTTLYHNGTQVAQSLSDSTTGNFSVNTIIFGDASSTTYCPNGRYYGGAIFLTPSVNIATLDAKLQGYCTA